MTATPDQTDQPGDPIPRLDESLKAWAGIHRETRFFSGKDAVVALKVAHGDAPRMLASACMFALNVWDKHTDQPAFRKFTVFVPPDDPFLGEETVAEYRRMMREQNALGAQIALAPLVYVDVQCLTTLDADALLERLRRLPEGSFCCVASCDLYRSSALTQTELDAGQTPLDGIIAIELRRLVDEMMKLAVARRLTIIVFGEYALTDFAAFDPDTDDGGHYVAATVEPSGARLTPEICDEAREAFASGGWPGVEAVATRGGEPLDRLGAVLFEVLHEAGDPRCAEVFAACAAIERDLLPGNFVEAAGVCLQNGDVRSADGLLRAVLTAERPPPREVLLAGHETARHADLEDVAGLYRQRLARRYPNDRVVGQIHCRWLFEQRRFVEAREVARRVDDPVLIAQAEAFVSKTLDCEALFTRTAGTDAHADILLQCADEALRRNGYRHAILWCRMVPPEHPGYFRAFELRVQAAARGLARCMKSFYLEEFNALCRIAAQRPDQPAFRIRIFWLLEQGIEEPRAKYLLCALLDIAVRTQSTHDDATIAASRRVRDELRQKRRPHDEAKLNAAMDHYLARPKQGETQLGAGELPPAFTDEVGAEVIETVSMAFNEAEVVNNTPLCRGMLHLLVLLCACYGDPTTDLSVLGKVTARHSVFGDAQKARDLAENALDLWTQTQPSYRAWRTGLAWLVSADAFLRAGNLIPAAACTCFAHLAFDGPGCSTGTILEFYRLCARIFRDMNFFPWALMAGASERGLLEKLPENPNAIHSLDVFLYQVAVRVALASGAAEAAQLMEHGEKLFEKAIEAETVSILSTQSNLVRCLGEDAIPAAMIGRLRARLAALPGEFRPFVEGMTHAEVTREHLVRAIDALPKARFAEDLGFQVNLVLPLACNALEEACAENDPELFLLAASLLSQPAMAVNLKSPATADAADAYSFGGLADLRLADLQACLEPDEAALILAGEPVGTVFAMRVTREEVSAPRALDDDEWSRAAFVEWRHDYFEQFDFKIPKNIVLDPVVPPARKAREFMRGLQINVDPLPKKLVILPATHLFGFTFNLAVRDGRFLGQRTNVSIAPSASWLIEARGRRWSESERRVAWLGSRHSDDPTLRYLREYVRTPLNQYRFDVQRDNEPHDCEGAQIAFVGAHGGTGIGRYFRSVGDRVFYFTPTEMALKFRNVGCAILAVCSSGQSNVQHGSEEALGLTAALLRAGVRCVVAPPWPLDTDVVKKWLPEFFYALENGATAGEAMEFGRMALEDHFQHALPELQLHLYGDAAFRISEAVSKPASSRDETIDDAKAADFSRLQRPALNQGSINTR